jgi:hypothetical protein
MRYVMLINGNETEWDAASPAEAGAGMAELYAWFDRLEKAGKLGGSGAQLDSTKTAKTIRRGVDGNVVVTDGPYLELKEVIGGFVWLETESLEEAVRIASTWPTLTGSTSIEVRPIIVR